MLTILTLPSMKIVPWAVMVFVVWFQVSSPSGVADGPTRQL